jgi:hypothetical protein
MCPWFDGIKLYKIPIHSKSKTRKPCALNITAAMQVFGSDQTKENILSQLYCQVFGCDNAKESNLSERRNIFLC